ncbi:hypothetical protein [Novosphingobium sp.]|uniref:hypothetical protein n=1 Tax=Novosphingobium sp. TaxID=1874826 RepID=UPI0033425F62
MRNTTLTSFGPTRTLLGIAATMVMAIGPQLTVAQPAPQGPPPPGAGFPAPGGQPPADFQGPPPGIQGPPRGGPGDGVLAQLGPPPGPVLTPAQKLVAALPPPAPGGMPPRPPLPADAAMPSADRHDLQGTWIHNLPLAFRSQNDMYGAAAPYTMAGAKVIARRVQSLKDGKPFTNASALCRPPGPQWQFDLNFPFQIMQAKDRLEFIFEEYHGRWTILLDPAKAAIPARKSYMGTSVGHWDGNTLVVETGDFRQAIWMDVDGTPLSANGKLIQRIRKVANAGQVPFLEVVTTIVDPANYTAPWSIVRTYGWNPYLALFTEYNCEEQIGDPGVKADAGLVAEPKD